MLWGNGLTQDEDLFLLLLFRPDRLNKLFLKTFPQLFFAFAFKLWRNTFQFDSTKQIFYNMLHISSVFNISNVNSNLP